jgi:hypothetical protein
MQSSTWLCLSVLALAACGKNGTETDNPLIDFDQSACKQQGLETALVLPGDAGLPEVGDFCAAYGVDESGQRGRLQISNYPSACGSEFAHATASLEDGTLELVLHRDDCTVARCGSCAYDLDFVVQDPPPRAGLRVELREAGCEGTPLERAPVVLTLPTDANAGSLVCEPF